MRDMHERNKSVDQGRRDMLAYAAAGLLAGSLLAGGLPVSALAAGEKTLPPPDREGGMPLMKALSLRKATRSFSSQPLTDQDLSNLLWATWGINRPDGRRTAPTARNRQEALVFAARQDGVWRYDAVKNSLIPVLPDDTRSRFGGAPLTLLYAAPANDPYSAMHVGSLYQNAGLYCASAGLANVVKAQGKDALSGELKLPAGWAVLIVQSIGRPA